MLIWIFSAAQKASSKGFYEVEVLTPVSAIFSFWACLAIFKLLLEIPS